MNVPQVACGAYHSVALVRSLPAKNRNTQAAPEKRERGRSPHFFVGEREELSAVDGGHYCPLGVELTEGASGGEVNTNHFGFLRFFDRCITRHFCQSTPVYIGLYFFQHSLLPLFSCAVPDSSKQKGSKAKAAS